MKGKRAAFVCLMLSLVLLISGGVTSFLVSLKEDRELTLKRMVIVNDEFEDFSNSTTSFESYRDELYNNVLGSLYYDSLGNDDANIKNVLSNYEAMVDSLEKKAKSLDDLCKNVYYPDSSVNSKCNNYKSIFEQVNNFFVGDIALYNKIVYNKERIGDASMKAATGELNLTVITLIAIGAIIGFFWIMWPKIQESINTQWDNISQFEDK